MRILLLNQYYWPDVAATAQILTDLAEGLVRYGHEVTVICSRRSYTGNGPALLARERRNGVQIIRLPAVGGGKKASFGRRLADFMSFYALAAVKCLSLPKHDVVVTLTTPPLIGLVGRMLQLAKGTRHVHWCMDMYPDIQLAHGMIRQNGAVHRLLSSCTRSFVRAADAVCVLGPHMRTRLLAYEPSRTKVHTVPVWADGDRLKPVDHNANWFLKKHGLSGKFVVMYSGNIGAGSSFDTIVQVIRQLGHDPEIRFAFIGDGSQLRALKRFAKEHHLRNLLFLPYQNRQHLRFSLSAGDAHLVTVKPGLEGMKVPGKTYGIMAVGRPIIYIGNPKGEVYDLVKEQKIGCAVEEGDVQGLLAGITFFRQNPSSGRTMGHRARRLFEESYDSAKVIPKMERILREVTT